MKTCPYYDRDCDETCSAWSYGRPCTDYARLFREVLERMTTKEKGGDGKK